MLFLLARLALGGPEAVGFPADAALAGATAVPLGPDRCVLLGHEVVHMYVHGGPIAVTHDGGRTWQAVGRHTAVPTQIRVVDPDTVWLLEHWQIEGVYPDLLVSRDGGRTWSSTTLPEAAGRTGECCFQFAEDLRARDGRTAAVLLAGFGWIETTDGGATWTNLSAAPAWPNVEAPPSTGMCRVVDADGRFRVEIRAGEAWRVVADIEKARPS